jgi:hypothetical protein
MKLNECLMEGAALAHTVQVQLLVAVVFMAQDPDRALEYVRRFSTLRHRMTDLVLRSTKTRRPRRPAARSPL